MKEIWKEIPGFTGYQASNLGRLKAIEKLAFNIRSNSNCIRSEKILRGKPNKSGYITHTLKSEQSNKKAWLAHRIVAIAWLPNPDNKPFINHKNGNKVDNRIENLEWCTRSENGVHAVKIGLHTALIGETNGNHKLSETEVKEIRRLHSRYTQKSLAARFGIGRTTVQYIIKKKLWAHL